MSEDVSRFFSVIKTTSEGWKACCPMCGNTDWTFHWNTEKNVGCCHHSSCGFFHGRGGVTTKRLFGFFHWKGAQEFVPEVIKASEEADVQLPKEFKLIGELDSKLQESLYDY